MSDHDEFEREFWGDCTNTFDEEQKHYVYSQCMKLQRQHYTFHLDKPSKIIDIGGGPTSMMLKTKDVLKGSIVVDPLANDYPQWVHDRYETRGIKALCMNGEDIDTIEETFDEAWMYNVLQHTDDPIKILKNMLKISKKIRIFEWIDIPPHEGHPHMLTEKMLNETLGVKGHVSHHQSNGCYGKSWSYSSE